MNSRKNSSLISIDGHVHFYKIFDPDLFFQKSINSFAKYFSVSDHVNEKTVNILFFSEGKENDFFSEFKKNEIVFNDKNYKFFNTDENVSLKLMIKDKDILYIIRGRQIVTRENIEILHIGTDITIKDGTPAKNVLEIIKKRDETAIIAWGFGKWFFGRKKVVRSLLQSDRSRFMFIGDNSARPTIWPTPRLFLYGKKRGIKIINGSDPLPIKGEEKKPGSYFFSLTGEFNTQKPYLSIKNILTSKDPEIIFHGKRDSVFSFIKRQSAIYLKKYLH